MKSILLSIRPEWVAKILTNENIEQFAMEYVIKRIESIYHNMLQRCYNSKSERYDRYGGRGICVCDEWLGYDGKNNFILWACENGFKVGYSIERIDVDKNYCPQNCKWIPLNQQSINKGNTHWITHNGETHCLQHWCKLLGLKSNTIKSRVRKNGGDYEKALFEYHRPVKNEKTHCPRGHEYTPENTGWNSQGYRYCKECMKKFKNDYNEKRREKRRLEKEKNLCQKVS